MRLIDADAIPWTDLNADMPNSKIKVLVAFADKINRMPTIEPEPHWIPCSERLPELDEDGYSDKVLVCFSNFTGCEVCEYRECDDCHGWYVGDSDDNPEDVGVHVIAWMPLPECYREDEG